jgi:predicted nucleotidyltransferase component of viral defense system
VHREDWNAVYINQDRILNSLKGLNSDVFLAGGTGLHRFVFSRPYRHSEDLDFFFPTLFQNEDVATVVKQVTDAIRSIPGANIEKLRRIKEEGAYRLWCSFEDNDEIVKVEFLNFTCDRFGDHAFIVNEIPFQTENLYNLLLYKLKALCDRPDTIKDLFDLYFIFRDLPAVSIDKVIQDLNAKFEDAIGIRYEKSNIIQALEHDLKWDIEVGEIDHLYDLQSEVNAFQIKLKEVIANEEIFDFSYQKRIAQRAKVFDLNTSSYLELIDVLEENNFWIDEVKRLKLDFGES